MFDSPEAPPIVRDFWDDAYAHAAANVPSDA
jgi:hypothetical protein